MIHDVVCVCFTRSIILFNLIRRLRLKGGEQVRTNRYLLRFYLLQVILLPLYFLKIKPSKIVVSDFGGRGLSDNPKYIVRELLLRSKKFDIVCLVNDKTSQFPNGVRTVKSGTFRAFYELSTAKLWIDNIRNTWRPIKKREQLYLQTWHGSFGPKHVEQEAEENLSSSYIHLAKIDGKNTDVILSGSDLQTIQMRKSFYLNKESEIFKIGLPRNDIFFDDKYRYAKKQELQKLFQIDSDTLVVLYMPTFRDNHSIKGYDIDFKTTIASFSKKYNKKVSFMVRFHPNVRLDNVKLDSEVIDVSNYHDSQELLLFADIMITDYSSAPFDFVLMRKPIFLYLSDFEEYKTMRGLSNYFENFPFPKSYSNDELQEQILTFKEQSYWRQLDLFFKKYKLYDVGEASARVVDWILSKINV